MSFETVVTFDYSRFHVPPSMTFASVTVELPSDIRDDLGRLPKARDTAEAVGILSGTRDRLIKFVQTKVQPEHSDEVISKIKKFFNEGIAGMSASDLPATHKEEGTKLQAEKTESAVARAMKEKRETVGSQLDSAVSNKFFKTKVGELVLQKIKRSFSLSGLHFPEENATEDSVQSSLKEVERLASSPQRMGEEVLQIFQVECIARATYKDFLQTVAITPILHYVQTLLKSPAAVEAMQRVGLKLPEMGELEGDAEKVLEFVEAVHKESDGTDENANALRKIISPEFNHLLQAIKEQPVPALWDSLPQLPPIKGQPEPTFCDRLVQLH